MGYVWRVIHFIITFKKSNRVLDSYNCIKGDLMRNESPFHEDLWALCGGWHGGSMLTAPRWTFLDVPGRPLTRVEAWPQECSGPCIVISALAVPGPAGLQRGLSSLVWQRELQWPPCTDISHTCLQGLERESCQWCLLGQRVHVSVFVSISANWPPNIV